MPATPDRRPGPLEEEEEIRFITDPGASPSAAGSMTYDPGVAEFKMQDGVGVFNPRSGGGISEAQHEALDTLVHSLDESHEQVPTFSADGIMTLVVAQGIGGGTLIRDMDLMTADSDGLITGARVRQRNGLGVIVQTITAVVTNTGSVPQKNVVTKT